MDEYFEHLKENRDKFRSQYIFIAFNISIEDFLDKVKTQLKKLMDIFSNDPKKKHYINQKIYPLVEDLNKSKVQSKKINRVYLIDKDIIHTIELTKKQIVNLTYFKCPNYKMIHGEYFDFEYLYLYLNDESFRNVLRVVNNKVTLLKWGKYKKLKVDEFEKKSFDIDEYIRDQDLDGVLVYGKSVAFKGMKYNKCFYNMMLTDEQVETKFKEMDMIDVHRGLQELLDMMQHPKLLDYVKFKLELQKGIESGLVEKLYVTPKRAKKVRKHFKDSGLLNFNIFEVETLKKGDPGDILSTNHGGVIWKIRYLTEF